MEAFKQMFEAKCSQTKVQDKLERKYGLKSGSVARSDNQVQAGWASMQGKRSTQEDCVFCEFLNKDGTEVGCFGVFDGHGGPAASAYVCDNLPHNILNHDSFHSDLFKAVEEGFINTDQRYLKDDKHITNDDGTTALFSMVVGQRLITAHVGDSRAVMHDGRQAVMLSRDHKPNRSDEKIRIEGSGGSVVWAGTWRVGGVLAVSRSFGNRLMKEFIIPHPEIREDILSEDAVTWVVLGSDGLWDVMSNEDAAKMARKSTSPEVAARKLATEAYLRGSEDNISVLVCRVGRE
ncbi:putative protein phosphatase 2C 13 [Auxenochlorella protothecoides]|uniref:PPM-type phosphatase domain-containing protein n=1 Tax=Auxenochlorella protothecoides TaxID=3075 RepID=A0A087SA55_AUXPR|nr:putative protein phosphatase 2C 13 [Auxenochlorella protothecoides]KFM22609.1 putative protein phosphatase 2C 13 [Auxenochlorella protothecoides]RMZ57687.1 hypothetical protein APUTEX25_001887 [Auxenochlorella protothecoides]|eukprot:RMZ57687.1 hypothetical protein APUTEX25_001887 [Auxenochlorella protothecoides]